MTDSELPPAPHGTKTLVFLCVMSFLIFKKLLTLLPDSSSTYISSLKNMSREGVACRTYGRMGIAVARYKLNCSVKFLPEEGSPLLFFFGRKLMFFPKIKTKHVDITIRQSFMQCINNKSQFGAQLLFNK